MKSIVVGTAGHIDHGKTALVKALTGIDADRLQEEKRRGITIDIGFAHLELPIAGGDTLRMGFVDVPGHERFVRNMLAGIGGIDLALLVVAADESIKPQTREHFDICRLLGVRRGITVLTKADLVERDTLDAVRAEVEEFLRDSFLGQPSPIVAVSALTGAGIDDLKQALIQAAASVPPKDSTSLAHLPIDRVFAMKGFGTVATGTLVAGTIREGEEFEVFPSGQRVRARSVQVHGRRVPAAVAGERTAVNLTGVAREELARGMALAPPSTFSSTRVLDAKLSLLPSAKLLKDHSRVHFHAYTAEAMAEVVLLGKKQLTGGQEGLARLRLSKPVLLLPGDRFIIRQSSPVVTIGGGMVLDATPLLKAKKGIAEAFLETLAAGEPEQILTQRILRRGRHGISMAALVAETGWREQSIHARLTAPLERGEIVVAGVEFFDAPAMKNLSLAQLESITDFHRKNPLVAGIHKEALRENFRTARNGFEVALAALVREGKVEVAGEQVRLFGRTVVMNDEESASKRTIEAAFSSAGLKVPALKDVLASLKIDPMRAQKIVTLLLRDQVLTKISSELVFHRDALRELRSRMAAEKTKSTKVDVARFKEITGVSRKYAIPLLEYLDREHVTRRVGDERVIL